MSKHTPGPWIIGDTYTKEGDKIQVEAFDEIGNRSLQVLIRCEDVEANAHLIAATPELLEALQEMDKAYHSENLYHPEAIAKMRAAIAKALNKPITE